MKLMRYLSSLNRRKMLSENTFGLLLVLFLIFAFYSLDHIKTDYLNLARYEITDGTEYRYLIPREELNGDKINTILNQYRELHLPKDRILVDVADLPIVDMIVQVYGMDWSGIEDVSEKQFYQDRMDIIRSAGEETNSLSEPIQLGYAEGWKNVNSGMSQCVIMVLVLISIVLVPIFNEDQTLGVDSLVKSTKYGTHKLNKIRIFNAFQISTLLYVVAVAIYVTPIFLMYSFEGADLPIQSNPQYFLSTVEVSYFQQFLINLLIGYVAVSLMTGITLLVSTFVTHIYTGYAILLFIMGVSYAIQTSGFSP